MKSLIKPLIILLVPLIFCGGVILYTYRSHDYTTIAKVVRKTSRDKSRNAFESSNDYRKTVSFTVLDGGRPNEEIDCDNIDEKQYDAFEIGKWYKVRIRYYPSYRLFHSSLTNYRLMSVDGGPFESP